MVAELAPDRRRLADRGLGLVEAPDVGERLGEEGRGGGALAAGLRQQRQRRGHLRDRLVEVAAGEGDPVAEPGQRPRLPLDLAGEPAERRGLGQPALGAQHRRRVAAPRLDPRERASAPGSRAVVSSPDGRRRAIACERRLDLLARVDDRAGRDQLRLDLAPRRRRRRPARARARAARCAAPGRPPARRAARPGRARTGGAAIASSGQRAEDRPQLGERRAAAAPASGGRRAAPRRPRVVGAASSASAVASSPASA